MEVKFQTELNSIHDIDKLLIEADMIPIAERAMIIEQALMLILQKFPLSLRFVEYRYRSLASQTFLIAAPKADLEPMTIDGLPADYRIWVEVSGAGQAEKLMRHWGIIDREENAKRLEISGFVVMPRN